jgi:hypothetical protein
VCRLPAGLTAELSVGMFTLDDEELQRAGLVGVLAHQCIAELAGTADRPTPRAITAVVDRSLSVFRPIEARAHRQNLAGAIGAYFWHLMLPTSWSFLGSEVHVGGGRVDLLWRHGSSVLVDEVKTGSARQMRLARTSTQIDQYLSTGSEVWGEQFLGVRLLCLSDPGQSLFIHPNAANQPLHTTLYVSARRS